MHLTSLLLSNIRKKRPFFVSTPIFYVNAAPHLGHLYTAVVADAVQRLESLIYNDCNIIYSTGTDEHGTKIQRAAEQANKPLQDYCDSISSQYRDLFSIFNIGYTDFVRTTEKKHEKAVHSFWRDLEKRDCIYKAQYSGWYSVNDETFVPESQVKDDVRNGKSVKVSLESGHPLEWTEETNYMFRLSAYRENLQKWLSSGKVIMPTKYQKQLQEYVSNDNYIPDISISRPSSRVHWAIRVPNDDDQSIYVWLDALVNYLTVAGYPDMDEMESGRIWPADVHVVGKDILKFHGIYWPAFLMAVGLHPPRRILCHGHWTVDGQKMSKSIGNVVDPLNTPGGPEALRYFLLREGTMHSDANFSEVKLVRIINSELADTLGNLLGRCTGKAVNPSSICPELKLNVYHNMKNESVMSQLVADVDRLADICKDYYASYQFYKVVDAVISTLHKANLFFETLRPWEMRKIPQKQSELNVILNVTMETLRICSIILQPIIPNMSEKLLNKLNVPVHSRKWKDCYSASWSGNNNESRKLSNEKLILFQRILYDDKIKRKL